MTKAVYFATKSCMRTFGFDFDGPRPYKTPAELARVKDAHGLHEGLYGLFDAEQAARMGYHVSEGPAVVAAVNAREARYSAEQEAHSKGYLHVLTGWFSSDSSSAGQTIPEGGCVGSARKELYGSNQGSGLTEYRESLVATAWTETEKDSRVQAVYGAWGACMRLEGYQYPEPMDANNDPQWVTPEVSNAEIAVAVADVGCKRQTNLVGILMAVESVYQRKVISAHTQELQALEDNASKAVEQAKDLLSH